VSFQSIHDGSKHLFTPENVVNLQRDIGSDIMMMLDVCSPVKDITRKKVEAHLALTHQRAKQAYIHHIAGYKENKGVLFPIIQGGLYPDLRQQSAEILKEYALDGIAIGGLSVGETREEMFQILDDINPHLPIDKPRYVMGIGTPEDLIGAIERGVDMFDCVMPTRLGRHGQAFSSEGSIRIKNQRFAQDF
jgi:queuine tRNA-ribosyltransferase